MSSCLLLLYFRVFVCEVLENVLKNVCHSYVCVCVGGEGQGAERYRKRKERMNYI